MPIFKREFVEFAYIFYKELASDLYLFHVFQLSSAC